MYVFPFDRGDEETISDYSLSPFYLSPSQDMVDRGEMGDGDEDRVVSGETIEADEEAEYLHLTEDEGDEETIADYSLSPYYLSPSQPSPRW